MIYAILILICLGIWYLWYRWTTPRIVTTILIDGGFSIKVIVKGKIVWHDYASPHSDRWELTVKYEQANRFINQWKRERKTPQNIDIAKKHGKVIIQK